ncbi:MAG TPA: hypothetical protein VMT18_08675 [Planctomycetota bacterium]|nr:hypothetical protein [Planctomycetota bacterium]
MPTPDPRAAERLAAAWAELEAELDWERLGASYCEGDARTYFDAERRAHVLDTGLALADDVAARLPARPGTNGPARSLYVGAAVAELAPMLVERLVLAREVRWHLLPGPEFDELARALARVGERLGLHLPLPDPRPLETVAPTPCDHLWLVSVLTDPDAFPALHDALYERAGTPEATGRGDPTAEGARAAALVVALLAHAAPGALLTTTTDELPLLREQWPAGARVEPGRITSLVGDRVAHVRFP